MQSLALHNDGVKYLLTCIDTFSKYACFRSLKNKSGLCVKEAFEYWKKKSPLYLQTDKGTEFKNTLFPGQLTECKIKFYTSENDDIKAAILGRFNRTLKTRMHRYFTHSKSYRYVDVLQELVHSYNHTYHSSVGMSPVSVNVKNEDLVRQKLFHKHPEKPTWRFDIDRRVRISKRKQAFEKGYLPGWSEEIFVISKKLPTTPVTYAIKDMSDEEIK